MRKVVKLTLLLALAICWMALIFKLSGMNGSESGDKARMLLSNFIEDAVDFTNGLGYTDINPNERQIEAVTSILHIPVRKIVHATVYLILAMFVFAIVTTIMNHNHYFLSLFITLAICVIFATFDEFHQTFVPGRNGAVIDVVIDSVGALVGILFYTTYYITYELGYNSGRRDGIRATKQQKNRDDLH